MRKLSRTSDLAFASIDRKDIQNGGSQFYEGPFKKNMEKYPILYHMSKWLFLYDKSGLTVRDPCQQPILVRGFLVRDLSLPKSRSKQSCFECFKYASLRCTDFQR